MKIGFNKKKAVEEKTATPRYSIRILDENWVEAAVMLRKDYDKKWLEVTATTGIVDGSEIPVTRLTFESNLNEYIDIRVKLSEKKIEDIDEKVEKKEDEKK